MNKKKIFNDPVYGFINIPNDLIYDLIEHPYFQRLRRIKQLGLSDYVYPGALHTRFNHALGAMHLMKKALDNLKEKGHMIFDSEYEGALIAILLHDIGHGPFSHSLEFSLFKKINHEQITTWVLSKLNQEFKGRLSLAIEIFQGRYPRKFLTQLVSSQLDIDRLDYLKRDCFFTGVQEGSIGAERIIKMLNVIDDELVVEEKGIYSIESFISARRIMYWQVYLHKTAVSAEKMLIELIKRVKICKRSGMNLISTPALSLFLNTKISKEDFETNPNVLQTYMELDDTDIWGSIKFWIKSEDPIIHLLSNALLNRDLFKIQFLNTPEKQTNILKIKKTVSKKYDIPQKLTSSLVILGRISNAAYTPKNQIIKILRKNGKVEDISAAVDLPNIKAMSKIVEKNYLCYPKNVSLEDYSSLK
ncbi:MAG: HD domain-containing protein [Flammeovirgaceae bacterium]|nr:HD domain-containing protein [Flammeovirgaceae bacterium]